jgi:hypothetical protein
MPRTGIDNLPVLNTPRTPASAAPASATLSAGSAGSPGMGGVHAAPAGPQLRRPQHPERVAHQPPAPCLMDAPSTPTLHQRRGPVQRPAFLEAMSVQGPARRNRQVRQESIEGAG